MAWSRRVCTSSGVQLAVDPLYAAMRVALYPPDPSVPGQPSLGEALGYYRVYSEENSQSSATGDPFFELVYGFGAGAVNLDLGSTYLVLLRLMMFVGVISTGGGAGLADYDAIIIRKVTVPVTAARFTPTKLRGTMRESAALASGQGAASGTFVADSSPFSFGIFPNNNTLQTTATLWQGAQSMVFYAADQPGQSFPVVCANQEGVRIRVITGSGGGAKFRKRVVAEWAEVMLY